MRGEGGNGNKGEEHLRHVSLLFLSVLPTTLARLVLRTQAERSAARKPPDEWHRLAATVQLVTEVTNEKQRGDNLMNLWKRQGRLFGLVTSIIFVLLLSACGSSGPTTTTTTANGTTTTTTQLKIMVGGLSKQIYLPNMLTHQLGYFQQEGLDVTLIDEASGQSSENEVLAGQVDAGSGSYNHTIELQAAGKQMQAVVLLNVAPGEAEIVSAKAASQIHSVADLKGKNLGVTELGSGTQTLTTALLQNAGITKDQVHFVPVGAGDTFIAALQQGKIDAGMTTEPTISRILSSGAGKVLVDLRSPQSTAGGSGWTLPVHQPVYAQQLRQ